MTYHESNPEQHDDFIEGLPLGYDNGDIRGEMPLSEPQPEWWEYTPKPIDTLTVLGRRVLNEIQARNKPED